MEEVFVILDANALVHSSFHGYEPQLDKRGEDQRVLYGLLNAFVELAYAIPKIDCFAAIFDPEDGYLHRKSIFPQYKENRPPKDEDMSRQKRVAEKVFSDHLGIPTVSHPGYEADDIIGSLAIWAKSVGYKVIIVSPDKDLMQLVQDGIMILRKDRSKAKRGYEPFNEKEVVEKYGIAPSQIPDWLALTGDSADNLPGIKGVGEKTAAKLLGTYPSVEHLLSFLGHMEEGKIKEALSDGAGTLPIVKALATIVRTLPIAEKVGDALAKADRIRSSDGYAKKLDTMERHYGWPSHFAEMFK